MSRFDCVKYDGKSIIDQNVCKEILLELEYNVDTRLEDGRAKAMVLTKIEEAYMWIGKAIRDDQSARKETK